MGPSQISDTPLQGFAILDVEFCELYRFGLTRARAPQKVFFLISMERSAEKGIHRSERQVPEKNVVSLAAFTSLPCMFSLTLHLNFRHFDCLSAGFISPLLFFSEASLWQIIVVAIRCWRVFPSTPMWTCTVLLASLLTLASYCCCFMKMLSDKVLQYQQAPNLENYEVIFRPS